MDLYSFQCDANARLQGVAEVRIQERHQNSRVYDVRLYTSNFHAQRLPLNMCTSTTRCIELIIIWALSYTSLT